MHRTMVNARSRVTAKGHITLPKVVREHFGLVPGDEIEFIEDEEGMHVRRYFPASRLDEWVGYLKEYAGCRSDDLVDELRGR